MFKKATIMKPSTFLLLVLLGTISFSSCFKEPEVDPDEIRDNWETDILAPIMRTRMFIEDAANLADVQSNVVIDAATINPLWSGPMIVPAVSGLSTQAKPSEFGITEYFERVYTDTLNMTVTLTNNLPIPINRGTILVYRNKETQSIIAKKLLDKDVEPGESYEFEFLIYNEGNNPPLVESDIQFYLEDFRTSGSEGQIVDFSGGNVQFEFILNWIKINEILINSDKQFADTIEFGFEIDGNGTDTLLKQAFDGKLLVFMESGMPLNVLWSMDLVDENDDFLMDFGSQDIDLDPAETDHATGEVTKMQETKIEIALDPESIDKLMKARKVKAYYDINTLGLGSGGVVRINENSFIDIQVVADLLIRPGKIETE